MTVGVGDNFVVGCPGGCGCGYPYRVRQVRVWHVQTAPAGSFVKRSFGIGGCWGGPIAEFFDLGVGRGSARPLRPGPELLNV